MFHVIQFSEDMGIAVVPATWLTGNMCAWPGFKAPSKHNACVRSLIVPSESWERYPISRIMYSTGKIQAYNVHIVL